jgi:tetratricopeptide (TPR) repeat protein
MFYKYLIVFLFVFSSAHVFSHEQINRQISRINQKLLKNPDNQNLLLNRASLYFAHSEFEAALKDLQKVVTKNPNEKAWILKGEALLELHRNSEALVIANRAVKRWPNSSKALLLRARAKAKFAGQIKVAVKEYDQAIALLKNPPPSLLVERADVQLSIGSKGETPALKQLADARIQYGFIYVLQNKALEIAQKSGQLDSVLMIVNDINQHMDRHDKWLMIMGDTLMKQGKVDEAKKNYAQALKAIKSLSNRQKSHSKTIQRKVVLLQLIKGS